MFLRNVGSHKIYTAHIPEDGILGGDMFPQTFGRLSSNAVGIKSQKRELFCNFV
jgi:hypothetical protein